MKKRITNLTHYFLLIVFILSFNLNTNAQKRACGAMISLQEQINQDPSIVQKMQNIETHTRAFSSTLYKGGVATVSIPVVVHVVYNTSAQNISLAQIQSQINILNADYRKLNADTANIPTMFKNLASDVKVEFVLAKRDPAGNATTGVLRKQTTTTSFTTNDNVKRASTGGDDAWTSSSYLNLWVCPLGGGLLGYAQFPGGGAAATDGVVINVTAFGNTGTATAPFNKGRTATHEVGHWLNLYHIWGDDNGACTGSDNVGDTPNQGAENYGCPTFPHTSCSNTSDMYMNYMDYTDDACMNMFSAGQTSRMNALFAPGGARVSLLSSLGGVAPVGGTCAVPSLLVSSNITSVSATISWANVASSLSYNIQYKSSTSSTFTTVSNINNTLNLTGLIAATTYTYQVQSVCSNGTSAYSAASTFTTSAASTCAIPNGLTSSAISATAATLSWGAVLNAVSYNIQYKTSSTSALTTISSTTNNKTITGLTASTVYSYQVQSVCSGTSSSAYSSAANFTTIASSTACIDSFETNETQASAKAIATNTNKFAKIGSAGDIDWFSFTNTSLAKNIQVTLGTLAADYDLYLYAPTGTLLAQSINGGTTAESLKYNNGAVGKYFVKVIGFNNVFNANSCYTLLANISNIAFRLSGPEVITNKEEYRIYPNPASDIVTVDFISTINKTINVSVYDLTGRLVLEEKLYAKEGANKQALNLSSLSKGIYLIECNDGNKVNTSKLSIER